MTFASSRVGGYADGTTVTHTELNDIDINLPDAIDGADGGGYSNTSPIILQGALVMADHNARFTWRVDTTTIADASADVTVASDFYISDAAITAGRSYTLRHTGTVANTGDRLRVSRQANGGDTAGGTIYREDATPLIIWATGQDMWAEFVFDGTNWRTVAWGGDPTPSTI